MKIRFLGAAGTVTGSKYLLEAKGARILVDCGLFQGIKTLRLQNWEQLSVRPSAIDAVVLTHAHIDHSGYLPRLFRDGFRGKVYCTPPTANLCSILLKDSAKLMEEEARYANRKGFSKHKPALPLFTSEDAEQVLDRFEQIQFHRDFALPNGFTISFSRSGHILGAASVLVSDGSTRIAFSGDVGRLSDPLMIAPEPLADAEYLVLESTYGDRAHLPINPITELSEAIAWALQKRGSILIPAFAVGRAQQILYYLMKIKERGDLGQLPIFLDSPMASDVTALYQEFPNDHRLSADECQQMSNGVRYVRDVEESKAIQLRTDPRIIISASGMATGGRVLHYLKKMLPRPEDVVLFAGYQAVGTRGASLVGGASEIKIHGEYFPVRAGIRSLENLSAHADASEILEWLGRTKRQIPKKVFVTHGEPAAADALRLRLQDHFGWRCEVARQDQVEDLT